MTAPPKHARMNFISSSYAIKYSGLRSNYFAKIASQYKHFNTLHVHDEMKSVWLISSIDPETIYGVGHFIYNYQQQRESVAKYNTSSQP